MTAPSVELISTMHSSEAETPNHEKGLLHPTNVTERALVAPITDMVGVSVRSWKVIVMPLTAVWARTVFDPRANKSSATAGSVVIDN